MGHRTEVYMAFYPVKQQAHNGCAKAMIRIKKSQLGLLLQEKKLTKVELDTVS